MQQQSATRPDRPRPATSGSNTIPSGTNNLFMFAMTDGAHAIMDALER